MSKITRRHFLLVSGASIALLTSACSTVTEINSAPFEETIHNVMISPTDGRILVAGVKYFYMFEKNEALSGVLNASFRKMVQASFGTFTLNEYKDISGSFTITINGMLSEEQLAEAKRIGFINGDQGLLVLSSKIDGVVFTPRDEQRKLPPAISKPYPVQVISATSHRRIKGPESFSEGFFVLSMFVLLSVFGN